MPLSTDFTVPPSWAWQLAHRPPANQEPVRSVKVLQVGETALGNT
jgi:hypothetical protein